MLALTAIPSSQWYSLHSEGLKIRTSPQTQTHSGQGQASPASAPSLSLTTPTSTELGDPMTPLSVSPQKVLLATEEK
jgi:hypothetical protein